jgi:hypothetical protein
VQVRVRLGHPFQNLLDDLCSVLLDVVLDLAELLLRGLVDRVLVGGCLALVLSMPNGIAVIRIRGSLCKRDSPVGNLPRIHMPRSPFASAPCTPRSPWLPRTVRPLVSVLDLRRSFVPIRMQGFDSTSGWEERTLSSLLDDLGCLLLCLQ